MQEAPLYDIFAWMEDNIKGKKGFIFDLDGTISMTQGLHFLAYNKTFKNHGVEYTKREDQTMYAGKGAERTFKGVFENRGKPLTQQEVVDYSLEKRHTYMDMLENIEIELVPGIEDFIKTALDKKIKISIATGSKRDALEIILERSGLDKYFNITLAAGDVEEPKPSPMIFLEAAKQIELSPNECIVFEDANMGIQAAKTAEMFCIGLATTLSKDELEKAGADIAVKDYNELIKTDFFANF